jgi:2-haloacid dehalogenase
MRRREFLGASVALWSVAALSSAELGGSLSMSSSSNPLGIKALTFDVFGTVVDWRSSIIREGNQWGETKGLQVDWAKFPIVGATVTVRRWTR